MAVSDTDKLASARPAAIISGAFIITVGDRVLSRFPGTPQLLTLDGLTDGTRHFAYATEILVRTTMHHGIFAVRQLINLCTK